MTKCAVKWCKSYGGGENKVSLHLFPRDPGRRRKWVAAVRREESWIPRKLSAICSLHFEEHCFNNNSKTQKKLKKDAVPTLYLPVYSHETNILKRGSLQDQSPEQANSPSSNETEEMLEPSKREFMRKIQKQARKIKKLQCLNRCLKKKIEDLEDALENATTRN